MAADKTTLARMAVIFNEWAKRYADNPEEFTDILSEDGRPVEDYGEVAAWYFDKLGTKLDAAGKLPKPMAVPEENQ